MDHFHQQRPDDLQPADRRRRPAQRRPALRADRRDATPPIRRGRLRPDRPLGQARPAAGRLQRPDPRRLRRRRRSPRSTRRSSRSSPAPATRRSRWSATPSPPAGRSTAGRSTPPRRRVIDEAGYGADFVHRTGPQHRPGDPRQRRQHGRPRDPRGAAGPAAGPASRSSRASTSTSSASAARSTSSSTPTARSTSPAASRPRSCRSWREPSGPCGNVETKARPAWYSLPRGPTLRRSDHGRSRPALHRPGPRRRPRPWVEPAPAPGVPPGGAGRVPASAPGPDPGVVAEVDAASAGGGPRKGWRPPAGPRSWPSSAALAGPDRHGPRRWRRSAGSRPGPPGGRLDAVARRPARATAGPPTTWPSGWPGPSSAPRTGRSSSSAAAGSSPGSATSCCENRPYDALVRDLIADRRALDRPPGDQLRHRHLSTRTTKRPDPERLAGRVAAGLPRRPARLRPVPRPPVPALEAGATSRAWPPSSARSQLGLTRHPRRRRASTEPTDRKTGKPSAVEPRVPFLPELLPDDRDRAASGWPRWVTDPRNPYFARATVNRVWALMFGRPLVEPVDDLPAAGELPPALHAPGRRLRRPRLRPPPPDPRHRRDRGLPARQRRRSPSRPRRTRRPGPSSR